MNNNIQTTSPVRVLYAAFEAAPFAKSGGLGEVAGSLPQALGEVGVDARLIMPKVASIPQKFVDKMEHIADFYLPLSWRRQYCGIERLRHEGRVVYFIDNEYYFKRSALYGYEDDVERMAFFAKAVVEAAARLSDFVPNIIHCNDWHTALCPVFLHEQYQAVPRCQGIKTVFSVHNLKFQGQCDPFVLGDVLGLADNVTASSQLIFGGAVNYLFGALCYADRLLTVSPTYAEEICTAAYGEGLEDVFTRRRDILSGILNGLDEAAYNPENDKFLPANFSAEDMSGKTACKLAVQQELGLEQSADIPLLVLISRLTEQKGLDLLLAVLENLLHLPLQVAVLGVGDKKYEEAFSHLDSVYDNFACRLLFDDSWAHRLYAGADMLLMPSRFEPCGLAQMIAMRYGTVPVVRATGGLKDSVLPYDRLSGVGNGFGFADYSGEALLGAVRETLSVYRDKAAWGELVQNALAADFGWRRSAAEYAALYRDLFI